MKKFKEYFLLLIIFIFPWQARWLPNNFIYTDIYNEYTLPSIFVIDVLMLLAVLWSWQSFKKTDLRIIFLVLGWLSINAYFAIQPFFVVWKACLLALIFWFIYVVKENVESKKIINVLIFSAVVQAILALIQFFVQYIPANTLLGVAPQSAFILGSSVIETIDGRWLRAYGTFPHPNILGGFLSIIVLLVIHKYVSLYKQFATAQWSDKSWVVRTGFEVGLTLVAFMVSVAGLIVSFSRTAWLAVVCGLITYGITQCRNKLSIIAFAKLMVAGALVVGMFVALYPQLFATRLTANTRLETASIAERVEGYDAAIELWRNNWIGGVGMGNYSFALASLQPGLPAYHYQPVHNVFVLMVIEVGLIGLVLLLMYLWRQRQSVMINELTLPLLVAVGVLAMFDHYLWSLHVGMILLGIMWLTIERE